jgi:hypothetical protein
MRFPHGEIDSKKYGGYVNKKSGSVDFQNTDFDRKRGNIFS